MDFNGMSLEQTYDCLTNLRQTIKAKINHKIMTTTFDIEQANTLADEASRHLDDVINTIHKVLVIVENVDSENIL